jgi:hypothetical protein
MSEFPVTALGRLPGLVRFLCSTSEEESDEGHISGGGMALADVQDLGCGKQPVSGLCM